ncbi:phosphohistidine phosphatase SixA [Eleftheria terrae]|uniref:phosphohistidine phosphatase SixA n=1 Tax=Eleftheria terrae TaxID=1597781 RepID=UPI00263BC043|nr:phosphohistidine phosphatase SixA [Eleftheria terrae]WKB52386.1 phosphohistidine phosphatase SixA [Eleftheria terrae]
MDLILWRHAEARPLADDSQGAAEDLKRPLTPKGERQAARMAEWLHRHLPSSARVLVSPALRTQQTAQALGRPFKTVPSLAPEAPVRAVLEAVRWPRSNEAVLVVGHQPTLGRVAAQLLAGTEQDWTLKKGAVWWLRRRERDGTVQVVLQAVQSVDFLG